MARPSKPESSGELAGVFKKNGVDIETRFIAPVQRSAALASLNELKGKTINADPKTLLLVPAASAPLHDEDHAEEIRVEAMKAVEMRQA